MTDALRIVRQESAQILPSGQKRTFTSGMRWLFILILVVAVHGCRTAPEPVDTPETRAAKAVALAAAAKDAYEHREFAQAVEEARHGLQLDETCLDCWYWLGSALFAGNQDDEAFTASKRFVELGATRPNRQGQLAQAYDRMGWIGFRKGRMDDAGKFFSLALDKAPTFAHALDGRGQVAYLKKDYAAAVRDLSKSTCSHRSDTTLSRRIPV
ncbi:MAG: hypothetical protein KGJ14_12675 [Nitrospirota bacterium]|nr:hypothetical protein [Nitrospirota bacterium]